MTGQGAVEVQRDGQVRGTVLPCPSCGQGSLDPALADAAGLVTCPVCAATAYARYVAEVISLAATRETITAREDWLLDRIAVGGVPSADELTAVYGATEPASAADGETTAPARPQAQSVSVQQLLLILGGATLAVAGLVFVGFIWGNTDAAGRALLLAGATLALLVAGTLLQRFTRLHETGTTIILVGNALLVVDVLLAAPWAGIAPQWWDLWPSLYPAVGLAVICAVAFGVGMLLGSRAWRVAASAAACMALVAAFLAAVRFLPEPTALWWPYLCAAAAVAAVLVRLARPASREVAAVALTLLGLALTVCIPALDPVAWPSMLVVTAAVAAMTTLLAWRRWRAPLTTFVSVVACAALVPWALAAPALRPGVSTVLLTGVAAAATGILLLVPLPQVARSLGKESSTLPWRLLAATVSLLVLLVAAGVLGMWVDEPNTRAIAVAVLVPIGLGVYLLAWRAPRLPGAVWVAAVPLAVAAWVALAPMVMGFEPIERWSLPVAALLAVAGATWWWQHRAASTAATVMPAVLAALLPSALYGAIDMVTSDGTAWVRAAAVGVISAVLIVAGARMRRAGLLYPGAVCLVIVLAAEVTWVAQSYLPRWLVLAVIGGLLIAAGARIEWLRHRRAAWARWSHELR